MRRIAQLSVLPSRIVPDFPEKLSLINIAFELHELEKIKRQVLPEKLLFDPVWNILLDLFVEHSKDWPVSISAACVASGVAPTTALRYIEGLERDGLLQRRTDPNDVRKKYIYLTKSSLGLVVSVLERFIQK